MTSTSLKSQWVMTQDPYIYFNSNPFTDELVNNWEIFRDEFIILAKQYGLADPSGNLILDPDKNSVNKTNRDNATMYKGNFKSIQLYMTDTMLDEVEKESNEWGKNEKERIRWDRLELNPFTKQFVLKYKDQLGAVNYNISYPGSRLRHHLGLDGQYLRLHLCVIESQGCVFDIEGWRHTWKNGELFAFDDGHVFHGTDHDPAVNTPRAILMFDVKKTFLKEFAKTWPCRIEKPNVSGIKKLGLFQGWE